MMTRVGETRSMNDQTRRTAINLADYEDLAKQVLPRDLWEHMSGGAADEITLRENVAAFRRIKVVPRVLHDVTHRDLSTQILGQPVSVPVLIAPVSCPARYHSDGELAAARAAAKAGTIFIASTGTCFSVEEIAKTSAAMALTGCSRISEIGRSLISGNK